MQPATYHPLLLSQIKDLVGESIEIPAALDGLLAQISSSYTNFSTDLQAAQQKVALRTDQLIASTSRAYAFLDSLNKGFIMCDVHGEVVLTNNSVQRILESGLATEASDIHWTLDAINSMLQPELELKQLILDCLESGKSSEHDDVNFGKRVLRFYIAPLGDAVTDASAEQLGVVLLVEDITEQKVLERSKDEFLSIASHELRTPLTAIRGNASLIKTYYADSITQKDVSEMIEDIHTSSTRLIEIVNDFLDVAAIEQGKITMNPEDFALQDIANDVVRELQHLCESKQIALVIDPSVASAPVVHGDRQRIKQVMYNLIGNSSKFTESGSITLSVRSDEQFVTTVITDTGRGMSPENQKLLFRKFQQAGSSLLTRDTTKGTGLGLYISKQIVELSGGQIKLESSEVGTGSVFSFSLPRAILAA